ncbi:MAG: DnaB-like helicase C-terminal domain-containing protein [Ruthenibacterium sp.]
MTFDTTDERAVLGCAVLSVDCARDVFTQLCAEDFTSAECAEWFSQLLGMWKRDGRVDAVTMCRLPSAEQLAQCAATVPSLSGCKVYIKHVKEHAMQMRAGCIGLEIATGTLNTDELTDKISDLARLVNGGQNTRAHTMPEMLTDFLARHQKGIKPKYIRVGMGLDGHIRLRGGNVLIIGARPSVGKTAFSLQMALQLAADGHRVAYFSLETGKEIVTDRLVSCACGYDYGALQENEIDFDTVRAAKEMDILAKYSIAIVDDMRWSVAAIETEALRMKADVVMVDYIGLVPGKGNGLYEQTTNVSKDFHRIAQRNGFLLVLLSQLNRAGTGVPTMENLRESGQIEQDADAIVLLHDNVEKKEYAAIVAKNKNGRCGAVKLYFDKEKQNFSEVDVRHEDNR